MYKKFLKRLLDILFSLIALPLFLLILLIFAPLIYISDRGPIFYNAPRLAKNGRVFKMFKFRSMKMNAPDIRNSDGSTFNSKDDPRLTKIGKFIRKTSIDEAPQILNILIGDMSLIGPRPDLPEHIKMYEGDEARKLEIRPGITGYNQAYFRNTVAWKDRIKNDIYYIDNISLLLDIKIIFKTAVSVLSHKNIYMPQDAEIQSEETETKEEAPV